jgi:hypothetical protein
VTSPCAIRLYDLRASECTTHAWKGPTEELMSLCPVGQDAVLGPAAMSWVEKLAILDCLSECSLRMRKPGDWYVAQNVSEAGGDGLHGLLTSVYGEGLTPEAAVLDHWNKLVDALPPDRYLVVHQQKYRWNGRMWRPLP